MEKIKANHPSSPQQVSLPDAYRLCESMARDHYENFPVGSLAFPSRIRRHVHAIYAFARIADDFADEGNNTVEQRLGSLDDWHSQLIDAGGGNVSHPVFIALADTIERFQLPVGLLGDLIKAFRTDVTKNRFETFEELLGYCRHSANPIGRLVLLLLGESNEQSDELSDNLCTALQLTNFWQDVSLDLAKGRIYIPLEDFGRFGYTPDNLVQHIDNDSFRQLMRFQVDRTRRMFRDSSPLPGIVGGRAGFELSLTWHGGMRILRKIERMDYQVLFQRPSITLYDAPAILSATLFGAKR